MKIAVAATPQVAIPTLDLLLESQHDLAFVITQPDRPAGRGRALTESAVSLWCREKSVPSFKPENSEELGKLLNSLDLLITIGYGVILPENVLDIPTHGSVNLHFSLLPRWRGAAPVQRAIEAGDAVTGVTVFKLDPGMDTGPIYVQKRFAVDSDISSDELLNELSEIGPEAILETLNHISSGTRPISQDDKNANRAMKLSKEEAEINWTLDAVVIDRKIRAFTSNPGAWTKFRDMVVKLDTPKVSHLKLKPGELRIVEKQLFVGTKTDALEIGFLTPSGKPRMQAISWANGARLTGDDSFG